jgi:hypothetical protein
MHGVLKLNPYHNMHGVLQLGHLASLLCSTLFQLGGAIRHDQI